MRNGIRLGQTFRLGRVDGIPVGLHWSLLVIAGLLTFDLAASLFPGGGVAAVVGGLVLAVLLLTSVLAHELGHAVVARHEGVGVESITLWLLGGVARLRGDMPSAGAAFRIAIAGPLVSIGLATGFGALAATGGALALPGAVVDGLVWLAFANGVLAVFNLLPAAPLDGGRVLTAALWAHHGDKWRATATATRAGRVVGYGLIGLGAVTLFTDAAFGGLWPMLLGWFLLSAAGAEEQHAIAQRDLHGVLVRDAMQPQPRLAPGWLTVEAFAERWIDDRTAVYPVARWEGEVAGVVTLEQLRSVPVERRHTLRVLDVATPLEALRTGRPEEPLADVLRASGREPPRGGLSLRARLRGLELRRLRHPRRRAARRTARVAAPGLVRQRLTRLLTLTRRPPCPTRFGVGWGCSTALADAETVVCGSGVGRVSRAGPSWPARRRASHRARRGPGACRTARLPLAMASSTLARPSLK